jgi:putative addiction module component (TIGR02574 family)
VAKAGSRLTGMKATLDEIARDALALSANEQEVLAEKLVGSLVSHVPPAIKKQQLVEVMQRRADVLSGKVKGVSAEQVVREIQALVH